MRQLKRIPVVLAWVVVTAAFLLLVLEESGILVDLVRARLARQLGPLGDGLTIERVSLRWFEPGLVVEDLRIHAPPSNADELEVPEELLHLENAGLSLGLGGTGPLKHLHVKGGRIRISDRLFEGLDAVLAPLSEDEREGIHAFSPPPFTVSDLAADLELPDGTTFELGSASVFASPDPDGRYRLRGRVTPVLAGLVSSPEPIYIEGRQWETGLTIRTAAKGLSLQSRGFRRPPALDALPIDELSGELTLGASARVDWSGERIVVGGELRAQLADGRILARLSDPLFEDVLCDLDLAFDLTSDQQIWDREHWAAKLRLGARWLDSPFEAWGTFGRGLPESTWVHAWARFDRLPLREELLERLGAQARELALWRSLGPHGTAALSLDLRLPPPSFEDDGPHWRAPALAVAVRFDGETGMTYLGLPDPQGLPRGFPVPVEDVRGQALFVHDPARERFLRLGLLLDAEHGSGRADAFAIATAGEEGQPWNLDLEIRSDSIAVDDTLRAGLDGHMYTQNVWSEYQPRGGTVGFTWRVFADASTNGPTSSGDIRVKDVRFAWSGLPIPFEKTSGDLTVHWARLPAWLSEDRLVAVRPFGIHYALTNTDANTGGKISRATVDGFVRDDFVRVEGPDDLPLQRTQGLAIDFEELLLRGREWEAVASRFPELAEVVDDLSAKGGIRVHFEGGRVTSEDPYRTSVEVTPTVTELSPLYFRRRTQDLRGRILLRTEEIADGTPAVETTLALAGRWSGDVELACQGELFVGLPSRLSIHGAGVDPTNTSFRGALFAALSGDEGQTGDAMDMSEGSLAGHVDFHVESELIPASEVPANNLYRIFLRDNVLETASLRLEDLHGVLEQRGQVLGSPRMAAALAGHPLVLTDVRVFRLADAAQLAISDPILQRPTFWSDPEGYAVQANLEVLDLPLDDRHLSSLLDEQLLEVIRESEDWRGALDVDGARIVVTSEHGGQGKVAVRGNVEPHDLAMRFGVPIEVPRARVAIEEMIFEAGRVRGWGRAEDLRATLFGRRLSNARMLFSYVDGRMSIDNLAGSFEGGQLESLGGEGQGTRKALAFDLAPPYHFDLALRLKGVEVASLLEDVFQSSVADAGLIDGGLRLRGTPRNVLGITGGGWLDLDEGRLWSIPVMRELFQQLGFDNTGVFDRMRTHFEVKSGRISTTDVKIRSNILNLVGAGSLDFDGTLSYDFEVRYSLIDRLGVFNRLLYWLNNSLWRVAVRGDMARPRVKIRNSILEFLKDFDETPPRELPLPDFTPFPERF